MMRAHTVAAPSFIMTAVPGQSPFKKTFETFASFGSQENPMRKSILGCLVVTGSMAVVACGGDDAANSTGATSARGSAGAASGQGGSQGGSIATSTSGPGGLGQGGAGHGGKGGAGGVSAGGGGAGRRRGGDGGP